MDDLFGSEGCRCSRSRCVGKHLGNQQAQSSLVAFGSGEVSLGSNPASTPATDGFGRGAQVEGNLLVGQTRGSRQNDLDAADKSLGRAVLAQQALKECLLLRRECKRKRLWARHRTTFWNSAYQEERISLRQ